MLKLISDVTHRLSIQKAFLQLHVNPHVLYYHMVANQKPAYYYQQPVSPDDFKFQIEWLLKNKFEFVTLSEIGKGTNKRQVAVTTDDGFAENYTTIAPILNDYKITATFFLINNCIDNKDLMWMNKLFVAEHILGVTQTKSRVYHILRDKNLYHQEKPKLASVYSAIPMKFKEDVVNELWSGSQLPRLSDFMEEHKPYLTTQQIQELLSAGFTIGGHTFSHPRCSELSAQELKYEVVDSLNELRVKFKTPVDYFAYPFGDRPEKMVEEEIFRLSKTTAFLGTKSSDLNAKRLIWERDKMEQPKLASLFWFSVLPMVRKFLLRPLKIYK